jgi:hypothetical protein
VRAQCREQPLAAGQLREEPVAGDKRRVRVARVREVREQRGRNGG